MDGSKRNLIFISLSQFEVSFSLNFVHVFLPFLVLNVSPYSREHTLLWIGAIMGFAPLCAAATSTFWGSLTHRFSPKLIYLIGMVGNTITLLLMGFTTNLYLLLILRVCQGLVGGISTVGMVIVSCSSPREKVPSHIGIFQSSLTLGQLVGPPLGSFAAVALGYRGAFVSSSVILFLSCIVCYVYLTNVPRLPRQEKAFAKTMFDRRILMGWMLCFTALIQLTFLPSVLPNVFERFKVEQTVALKSAGMVIMLYTATAMVGTYVWTWSAKKFGLIRMITVISALGVLLQALLALSSGVVDFTVIRMVQTGLIGAILPLVISLFARESDGRVIGFLNSARFAGNAAGPILATSILAYANLPILYLFISAMTLLAFLGFKSSLGGSTASTSSTSKD